MTLKKSRVFLILNFWPLVRPPTLGQVYRSTPLVSAFLAHLKLLPIEQELFGLPTLWLGESET